MQTRDIAGVARTAEACRAAFDVPSAPTIGVEEEIMLLDPVTLDLSPDCADVCRAISDPRFKEELPAAQLEIVSPPCADAAGLGRELRDARATLSEAVGGRLRLAGAGTHPFASSTGALSEGERYRRIIREYPWASARGTMVFGMHVHVAVRGADRTLAVYNALRSYLPDLAALAGNAPFLDGQDSGVASVRPKLAESFPRQGIPPAFPTWDAYVDLLAWGARGGAVPDPRHLWWELRVHPDHGTLEVRCPDQPATASATVAIAAVVQALMVRLADRYDAGEVLPVHDRERIDENRWRALAHGLGGSLLDLDTGEPEPTRPRLSRMLDELAPVADRLGGGEQLADARRLLHCNGAEQQREIAAREGLHGLVAQLAESFDA